MSTGFQQTEDLLNAIQRETDPIHKRLKIVELTKLLLEFAAMNDSDITNISWTDQLTDFFIEYLDTANHAVAFFQNALPHIDPELKAGEFENQIRETNERLTEIIKQSEKMQNANTDLLEQKNRIKAESEKLSTLKSELDNLRHLDEQLKSENMTVLAEQIELLKKNIQEKKPEKERLETEKTELNQASQNLEQMITALSDNNKAVADHLLELSKKLGVLLENEWDECDMRLSSELRKLTQRNNMYQEVLTKLDSSMKDLQQFTEAEKANRELYEKHFASNATSSRAIEQGQQNFGTSLPVSMEHISSISKRIAESLHEYDQELRKIMQAYEEIISRTRRLNKTT